MDSAAFAFSHHWKSTSCKKLPTGFHPLEALFRFYCFPVRLTGTIQIHAGLYRKLRGPSPNDGLCYASSREPHQTGEPWHLSCHGGKTPAKPHVPLCPLPAFGGQSGVKGHCPCEVCQTREPRGPSPSGGKTPAKQHVSRVPCAPMARSPGCRDTAPAQPARPASRGTCRATAVKPGQAACPATPPARLRRAVRGQGALPLGGEGEARGCR